MERCRSGLTGRPGKSVRGKPCRGFESLSLRTGNFFIPKTWKDGKNWQLFERGDLKGADSDWSKRRESSRGREYFDFWEVHQLADPSKRLSNSWPNPSLFARNINKGALLVTAFGGEKKLSFFLLQGIKS